MQLTFVTNHLPATQTEVDKFEARVGERLPNDYREFLLTVNGGAPQNVYDLFCAAKWPEKTPPDDLETVGINYFYTLEKKDPTDGLDLYFSLETLVEISTRIPANTVAIANDQGSNQYIMSLNSSDFGHVYIWIQDLENPDDDTEPDYRNVAHVADSFTNFLSCFKPYEDE